MPRSARIDAPGVLHHVIIRGIEKRKIFRKTADQHDFIDRLEQLVPTTRTACYAWALMSNHAHFLFRSGPAGMAKLMRRLLTGYAISFNRRYKRHGQFVSKPVQIHNLPGRCLSKGAGALYSSESAQSRAGQGHCGP